VISKRAVKATIEDSFVTALPPAIIYAMQNMATTYAHRNLDGVTYNILNQSKLLSTAVMGYYILGRAQTSKQIFALFILCLASILAVASKGTSSYNHTTTFGILAALSSSGLSGISGALSDLAMQRKSRNAFLFSAELSIFVLFTMIFGFVGDYISNSTSSDISKIFLAGGFIPASGIDSISSPAIIPILTSVMGGILVGQVTKLVGSVRKGFAVCAGIVLTAMVDRGDSGPSWMLMISIPLAVFAVIMHSISFTTGRKKESIQQY
jgi:UDP-sugar transporter A1/2/3